MRRKRYIVQTFRQGPLSRRFGSGGLCLLHLRCPRRPPCRSVLGGNGSTPTETHRTLMILCSQTPKPGVHSGLPETAVWCRGNAQRGKRAGPQPNHKSSICQADLLESARNPEMAFFGVIVDPSAGVSAEHPERSACRDELSCLLPDGCRQTSWC